MRILLQTRFDPAVGGIETLALVLCREWRALGHDVTVSTDVAESDGDKASFPYEVFHQPSRKMLLRLWQQHDVVVMMNVSLNALWPIVLTNTPTVYVHQSAYYIDRDERRNWRERLKLKIASRTDANICASQFIKEATGLSKSVVVPNCYDDNIFSSKEFADRPREIAFVGRLVSDKGCDLLLHAVATLPTAINLAVTVIGDGPEMQSLKKLASELGLTRVRFTGSLTPPRVADELRKHQLLVVPSLWREPFGIVALEGMACGCVPLVADGGGLPEAVGDAGMVFKRGNEDDLAEKLLRLLKSEPLRSTIQGKAEPHLAQHRASEMAARYLDVIKQAGIN